MIDVGDLPRQADHHLGRSLAELLLGPDVIAGLESGLAESLDQRLMGPGAVAPAGNLPARSARKGRTGAQRKDRGGGGAKSEEGKVTPLDVKAGDKILFGKWSGTEVKIDGEDLIIMKESDILGIVA